MAARHAGNGRTRPIAENTYLLRRYVGELNAGKLGCVLRHLLLLKQLGLTSRQGLAKDCRRHPPCHTSVFSHSGNVHQKEKSFLKDIEQTNKAGKKTISFTTFPFLRRKKTPNL